VTVVGPTFSLFIEMFLEVMLAVYFGHVKPLRDVDVADVALLVSVAHWHSAR